MSRSKDLVEVYVARSEAEAFIVKGLLESYGIQTMIKPVGSAIFIPVYTGQGIQPYSILVNKSDAEDARELVKGEQNV